MDGKKALIFAAVALAGCLLVAALIGGGFAAYTFLFLRPSSVTVGGPIAIVTAVRPPHGTASVKGFPADREVTDTTLSSFTGDAISCTWKKLDPLTSKKQDLAVIDGACSGARAAWSPDGTSAIVWLEPLEEGWKGTYDASGDGGKGGDRLWIVTLAEGHFTPLPPLPDGDLMEIGFDRDGKALALGTQDVAESDLSRGYMDYHGQRIDLGAADDLPILAHAFKLDSGAWSAIETKVTSEATDLSMGARQLDAWKRLGPRTTQMTSGQPENAKTVSDSAILAKLSALTKADENEEEGAPYAEGEWRELTTDAGPVYIWEEATEILFTTGLVRFRSGDQLLEPEKLEMGRTDTASPMVRGKYFLLGGQDGDNPHLYDVSTKKLLWTDETATGTTFWPKPS